MARIRHRNLSKFVQGSANKYGTAPTVGRNSFALRLFSFRNVPSKTDARASASAVAIVAILAWAFKKKLSFESGVQSDFFGTSVALDGNRALVGVKARDGRKGAAYIFDTTNGTNWSEPKEISLADGIDGDEFGFSVALDGNRALVGAPFRGDNNQGAAYIYDTNDGSNWTLTTDISLGAAGSFDNFGSSVALDGSRALVGAPGGGRDRGAAYIYDTNDGSNWTLTTDISLGAAGSFDSFGTSVALDGNRALVGAPSRGGRGAAYIYDTNDGINWTLTTDISLGAAGSFDSFGDSVALDGDLALVGAYERDGRKGAAYIFDTTNGTNWSEPKEISLADGGDGDRFGESVALDGNRALVGAPGQGAAYIYDYNGDTLSQPAKLLIDDIFLDQFGESVALDGNRALVGAPRRDDDRGAAYIYDYERTN